MLFFLSQIAGAASHGGEVAHEVAHEAAHSGPPHIANWVSLLAQAMGGEAADFLHRREKVIYAVIVSLLIGLFAVGTAKKKSLIPGKQQVLLEEIVLMLDGLVTGVLGPQGRKYTPFVGSLFIYILVSNWFGLVPLQNSATAYLTTTAPLALAVFAYVQWIGITRNGIKGYLYHMMGSPKELFGYILVPLNFPLHILGEFSKPVSLMFRLYGNVMAGHILVAVFMGLGIQILKPLHIPFGIPLHFPFLFLEILVGVIQAFVFSLLTTVYIAMMLPHDEHEHEAHEEHTAGAHA